MSDRKHFVFFFKYLKYVKSRHFLFNTVLFIHLSYVLLYEGWGKVYLFSYYYISKLYFQLINQKLWMKIRLILAFYWIRIKNSNIVIFLHFLHVFKSVKYNLYVLCLLIYVDWGIFLCMSYIKFFNKNWCSEINMAV